MFGSADGVRWRGERRSFADRASTRGAAMVEFAICVPLLVILLSGIIDLGRAYVLQESLQNSAREAAAFAAVHSGQQKAGSGVCADPANADWRGTNEGKPDPTLTFTYSPSVTCTNDPAVLAAANLAPGQPLRVTATKSMHTVTPLFSSDLKVSASVCVGVAGATPTGTCP